MSERKSILIAPVKCKTNRIPDLHGHCRVIINLENKLKNKKISN